MRCSRAAQCKLLGACSCVGLGWWPWGVEPSQTPCCNSFPILLSSDSPWTSPNSAAPPPGSRTIHTDTGSQLSHPEKLPLDSTFKFSLRLPPPLVLSDLHWEEQPPPAPSPLCHQSVPPAENTPGSLKCFPPFKCLSGPVGCTGMHRIIQKQLCDAAAAQISRCAEVPPRLELLQPS